MAITIDDIYDKEFALKGGALHPGLRAIGAQGRREDMRLGRVLPPLGNRPHGSPVWCGFLCQLNRKDRHSGDRASWLAKKASVDLNPRWPFVLQKYPSCIEASQQR